MSINKKIFAVVLFGTSLSAVALQAQIASREEELAQAKFDDEQRLVDRPIYVAPAPQNFKPRGKEAVLDLKLTVEASKIRRGTPIRYRFEITNAGGSPFLFVERTQSFFKTGRLPSDGITMKIKNPIGKTELAR